MIYFLFITALTVSIDSFVCGFSLSFSGGKKFLIVPIIALVVLVMCVFTNYLALILSPFLTEKTASLGGLILVGVGFYNLVKKEKDPSQSKGGLIKQSLIAGFAVGLDGALANLSLSIMGINAFYVPIVIAVMHAIMIAIGITLSETPVIKKCGKFGFLPPAILIALGIYKFLGFFI